MLTAYAVWAMAALYAIALIGDICMSRWAECDCDDMLRDERGAQ